MKSIIIHLISLISITSICITGCAHTSSRYNDSYRPSNLERGLNEAVYHISKQAPRGLKIAVADFQGIDERAYRLRGRLIGDLTVKFKNDTDFDVLERKKFKEILGELGFELTDLFDPKRRKEVGNFFGADALILGDVRELFADPVVRFHIRLVNVEDSIILASHSMSIKKDKELRKLLGERLPGIIKIKSNKNADIYINGDHIGKADKKGKMIKVSAGNHMVSVKKPGYIPYKNNIYMEEEGKHEVKVRFKSYWGVPYKSTIASALLPGLGKWIYGDKDKKTFSQRMVSISSTIFYIVGISYLVDRNIGSNFIARKDSNRHNSIIDVEEKVLIGTYISNVMFSFPIGWTFKKNNRRGVGVYYKKSKNIEFGFGVGRDKKPYIEVSKRYTF